MLWVKRKQTKPRHMEPTGKRERKLFINVHMPFIIQLGHRNHSYPTKRHLVTYLTSATLTHPQELHHILSFKIINNSEIIYFLKSAWYAIHSKRQWLVLAMRFPLFPNWVKPPPDLCYFPFELSPHSSKGVFFHLGPVSCNPTSCRILNQFLALTIHSASGTVT